DLFERAGDALRQAGRHDAACELLDAYDRVAPPRRAAPLRADAGGAWAEALRNPPGPPAPPSPADQKKAPDPPPRSAAPHPPAARPAGAPAPGRGGRAGAGPLRPAAACSPDAPAPARAVPALRRYLARPGPAHAGQAWYRLGETLRETGQAAEAEAAYRNCLRYEAPFTFRARNQLALAAVAAGQLD